MKLSSISLTLPMPCTTFWTRLAIMLVESIRQCLRPPKGQPKQIPAGLIWMACPHYRETALISESFHGQVPLFSFFLQFYGGSMMPCGTISKQKQTMAVCSDGTRSRLRIGLTLGCGCPFHVWHILGHSTRYEASPYRTGMAYSTFWKGRKLALTRDDDKDW